jgi:hypothetical protein
MLSNYLGCEQINKVRAAAETAAATTSALSEHQPLPPSYGASISLSHHQNTTPKLKCLDPNNDKTSILKNLQ